MRNHTPTFLSGLPAFIAAVGLAGCTGADPDYVETSTRLNAAKSTGEIADDSAGTSAAAELGGGDGVALPRGAAQQLEDAARMPPGAGWVDALDSFTQPFCGAVRIDARHIVTSTECAVLGDSLRFGMGETDSVPVVRAERIESQPELSVLELADSAEADEAAGDDHETTRFGLLDATPSELAGLKVRSVSLDYVPRGEASEHWSWEGELAVGANGGLDVIPAVLDAAEGAPNCHGDNGAGVFTHDGELVGVIVGASGHTEMGCARRFELARPSE